MIRKPARNAGFLVTGELLTRGLGFLVTTVLTRRLGLDGFGQIAFGMSIMAYGVIVTKAGLLTVGTRGIAREPEHLSDLTGQVLTLRILLAAISFAGICMFALLLPRPAETRLLLVLYGLGVFVQALTVEWVFAGEERMHHIAVGHILTNLVYFLFVFLVISGPEQLLLVPAAFVISTLAGVLYSLVVYGFRYGVPKMNWHLDAWRKLMTQALPVGIASILTQFYVNAPIVILALLVTDASAGLYSAAHRFVFFVLMLDRVIQSLFLPIASRQYHSRQTELPKTIGTITRIALVIAVPICVLVLLLAPRIAVLLFGDDFAAAGKIMSVLIWFLPFSLISTISGYTLLAANQERRYACNTAIGVVIAIALIIAGILRLGPIGAAIGMVIGEAILAMLMLAGMLRLRRPIVSWRVFWILPALVPLAVIVLLFRNANWMLSGIGGAIGYILLIAAVRGITPAEIGFGKQQSITDDTGSSQSKEGRVNRGQKRRSD